MPVNASWISLLRGALLLGKDVLGLFLKRPVLGVVGVPLDERGLVVMMRRRDSGLWCFPGGIVDWGETLEQALKRELCEETGCELQQVNRVIGIYSKPDRDPRMHAVTILVEARVSDGTTEVTTLETLAVEGFQRDRLPTDLAFDTARKIEDWKRGGE